MIENLIPKMAGGIRVLVVDDERLARSSLTLLLKRDADIQSVQECASGAEAVDAIRRTHPDIVFLDVQMPEIGGFDVLERLIGLELPVVVFVTAYDEYALHAFDAGALDYLLKPFDDSRFKLALERAKEKLGRRNEAGPRQQRLAVKESGAVYYVPIADIDWIEAADYYACLHVGAKSHLLRRSIADLVSDLDAELFCRIHRSVIVNLRRVTGLEVDGAGEYEVVLHGGQKLRLSRRFRKDFMARMNTSPMRA
jgi:two-component system, LytTR family, response regulator